MQLKWVEVDSREHIQRCNFTFTGVIRNIIQVQSTWLMGKDIQWRYSSVASLDIASFSLKASPNLQHLALPHHFLLSVVDAHRQCEERCYCWGSQRASGWICCTRVFHQRMYGTFQSLLHWQVFLHKNHSLRSFLKCLILPTGKAFRDETGIHSP